MTDIGRLLQRINKKIDTKRSLLLSVEELDMLVEVGAYKALADAALASREQASRERLAERRERDEQKK